MMNTIRYPLLSFWLILCLGALPAVAMQTNEVVRFGGEITVPAGETTSDVVCMQCSVRVLGRVAGDVVVLRGDVEIEGHVTGDVVALFGTLRLGAESEVGGDVVAIFGRVEREIGARTEGEVVAFGPALSRFGLLSVLVLVLLASLIVTLLFCLLSYAVLGERRTGTMATALRERAALAWVTGVGVLVFAILLFIISGYLGPATPILAIATAVMLFATSIVGYTGAGYWVGRGVAKTTGPLATLLLGVLVICLLQAIPFAGFLASLFFGPLALGVAVLTGFGSATDWLQRQFTGSHPAAGPAPPSPASP